MFCRPTALVLILGCIGCGTQANPGPAQSDDITTFAPAGVENEPLSAPAEPMKKKVDTYKVRRPTSNEELIPHVLSVMWDHVDFYESESVYRKSLQPATRGQVALYATYWYIYEVENGGHNQFFGNSTGMVWEEALAGFELIGAKRHREALAAAIKLFPMSKPSKDRTERIQQREAILRKSWDEFDKQLYAIEDSEFDSLATKYILDHSQEFFVDP